MLKLCSVWGSLWGLPALGRHSGVAWEHFGVRLSGAADQHKVLLAASRNKMQSDLKKP